MQRVKFDLALLARRDFYVYALFRENGIPFYVGKGSGIRFRQHFWSANLKTKSHKNSIIRGMLAKGIEPIVALLAEGLDAETAYSYEIIWIQALGRLPSGMLTNRTDGGEGSRGFSPETIEFFRQRASGYRHSEATKVKLSAAAKARDPEARKAVGPKISAALKGRTITWQAKMSASLQGRVFTDEWREKLRIASRKRWDREKQKETGDERSLS